MLGLAVGTLEHHKKLTDPVLAQLIFAVRSAGPSLRRGESRAPVEEQVVRMRANCRRSRCGDVRLLFPIPPG